MNDVKDILNKMKYVPEEMQDIVLKSIKEKVEEEIIKSYNPIDLVVNRLKELNFGVEKDSEQDRRIIRMIISCMPPDWFYMKPIYCESIEKTKEYPTWTNKWKVNEQYEKFINKEIKELKDDDEIYCLVTDIAQKSSNYKIDVINNSYWIYKDGANWETWLYTTKELAKEFLSWFECIFDKSIEDDLIISYKVLNKLEKYLPKEN